jgi:hypothetical protein
MQLLRAEWKKHNTFREAWVGYILGFAFLLVSLYMARSSSELKWFGVQQNIYTYGATLTAFLIVIGLSRLFCYERERNMDCLLRSMKDGLSGSYTSKVVLTVQYCAIIVAIIVVFSIVANGSMFGFADAFGQMTEGVYFIQLPMSNLAYCMMQYIFLFLGTLYFAGFVLIVATIVKRSAWVIVLCGGCFIAFLGYCYVGYLWVQGSWFGGVCDFLFYYGFSGFMLQESFSRLSAESGMLIGSWTHIWRPIIIVAVMIFIEFVAVWLLWKRKERK